MNKIVMYNLSITPLRIIPCHIAHFCRVISHSKRDIQHALLDKSSSVSNRGKQCYRDTYCFAYFICAYPCQMSRLACHVMARVPVSSPFYLFSRGGSHILFNFEFKNGATRATLQANKRILTWRPFWNDVNTQQSWLL